eukprot:5642780-Ditylum_brightwellii.AAC.1
MEDGRNTNTMISEIVQFLIGQDETIMTLTISPSMSSATGGECSFSVYNKMHTKKCNVLGDNKLDSIGQIRMNLKQLDRHMAVYKKNRSDAIVNSIHSVAFVWHTEGEIDNIDIISDDSIL